MKVLIVPKVENFKLALSQLPQAQYDTSYFNDIHFNFTTQGPEVTYKGFDCKHYNFVWIASYWGTRDLAYSLQLYLKDNKVKHTRVGRSGSKIVDHMIFSINQIPSPVTFYANTKKWNTFIEKVENNCKYPVVIKDIQGYRGKNTFLAHNREELASILPSINPLVKVMFQEYIPNDYDWGVLVANGKVVAAERSYPKSGEFRNNSCNGAREEFVPVKHCPDEVKNIAILAARKLKLSWCRADIVINKHTGKPYLLEINRYPGITKGTDEVKAVIKFLSDNVEKRSAITKY